MAPAPVVDDVDLDMEQDDVNENEEKIINEEYKTWKKNSPFLYDMILSTALDWPTLTTQWFPDVKEPQDKNYRVHRLLIGTHTSPGADNYLQIAEVEIPKSAEPNPNDYDEDRGAKQTRIAGFTTNTAPIDYKRRLKMAPTSYKLNTGQDIPALGLGTWQSAPGQVEKAVEFALKSGYKLIDAAYCYGNEDEVGKGLKAAFDSGIKREDIFVTTKLWNTYSTRAELGLDKSLKALGLDYVDLYLVHWPVGMNPNGNDDKFPKLPDGSRDITWEHDHVETWKAMEALMKTGKTKAVGVCNYSKVYMEKLLKHATIIPAVNQIEAHPALPQQEVTDFCQEKGIHIEAYSPLGSTGGPLMKSEPIVALAEKKEVSAATILLSYHVARGATVLAKSVTESRIKENMKIVDLDADDMKLLDDYAAKLTKEGKLERFVYPPFGINFGFPDKLTGRCLKNGYEA